MACRGHCFTIADGATGRPVVHEEATGLGMTWYFCPAHRGYHSMFLFPGAAQPLCGECAVLFFDRSPCAVWIQPCDLGTLMSNAHQMLQVSLADMEAVLAERREARPGPEEDAWTLLSPHDMPVPDVFAHIPKQDETYTRLGTSLIPHSRYPNFFLLEYRTFQGATAYQPCSKDIDSLGLFDALEPMDATGDPVFKQARVWSCILQAGLDLPKELRWILAIVYDFANEMLRPGVDDAALWQMRPWLMHWYAVADELLRIFGYAGSSPEVDWFSQTRPEPRVAAMEQPDEADRVQPLRQSVSSSQSSGCQTVIRHRGPHRRRHARPRRDEAGEAAAPARRRLRSDNASIIHAWLAAQPHTSGLEHGYVFDPTPRGFVPAYRHSTRLNPLAAVFDPRSDKWPRPGSEDEPSVRDSDVSAADSEGSGTDTAITAFSSSITPGGNVESRTETSLAPVDGEG